MLEVNFSTTPDFTLVIFGREGEQLEPQRQYLQAQLQILIDRKSGTQQTLTDLDDRKQRLEEVLQQLPQ